MQIRQGLQAGEPTFQSFVEAGVLDGSGRSQGLARQRDSLFEPSGMRIQAHQENETEGETAHEGQVRRPYLPCHNVGQEYNE